MMRKGLLIHNPKAGSLDVELLPKLVSALGEVVSVDIEQLGEAGDAVQYAEANHCDWIAVAGGDGTVESVASNLVGTRFPLGIIPAGHLQLCPKPRPAPRPHRGLPRDPCRERPTDGRGLRERKTVFRVPGLRLGRRPISDWGGDQVGSGPQVVRFHASRLPLSAPKIRTRARPTSL